MLWRCFGSERDNTFCNTLVHRQCHVPFSLTLFPVHFFRPQTINSLFFPLDCSSRTGFVSRKGNLSYIPYASPLSFSNFATSCPYLPSVPTLLMMIIGHGSDLLTWDDYRWLMMAFIDLLLHFMIRSPRSLSIPSELFFSCCLLSSYCFLSILAKMIICPWFKSQLFGA